MRTELPIEYPFKDRTEKLLILFFLITILLLTFGFFPISVERKKIIAKIPETETDAAFVIDEVYNKTSDIDLLLMGPCTIWWQIYTPYLQESLSQKYQRPAEVITLGFNHFGSDVMYLILKDLLLKRKVKNLLLALPKIEDLYSFPHQNAVSWWIYPKDLYNVHGLSINGYSRILGLNLFTSLYRSALQASTQDSLTVRNKELGFNFLRSTERLAKTQLPKLSNAKDLVQILNLEQMDLDQNILLAKDWAKFYTLLFELAKQNNINIFFVDSPHAVEFTGEEKTIPGNFPEIVGQPIPVVSTKFKLWQKSLPESFQNQIHTGHNLTVPGALLFTDLISATVLELVK